MLRGITVPLYKMKSAKEYSDMRGKTPLKKKKKSKPVVVEHAGRICWPRQEEHVFEATGSGGAHL